jgi:EmrB/QacA subfamily drug resistance transporter
VTSSQRHDRLLIGVLCTAALAWALGQTAIIPAFPELQRTLHTDPSGVAWTLTGYLLVAAVLTPVLGRVGDILGHRRVLLWVIAALAVGNAVSAVGSSLEVVVAGRVIQGAAGGIFPLCYAILRSELPKATVPTGIGMISALVGAGGGVGLILGGALVDAGSWRLIFWICAVMAACSLVAVRVLVRPDPAMKAGRVDLRGAAVLAIGLLLPLLAISQANAWGWTAPKTLLMAGAGVLVLVGWVRLQMHTDQPLADIPLLRRKPVMFSNAATLMAGFGIFGSFVLIPELAQEPTSTGYGLGLDALQAGLVMVPGSIAMLVLGPVSGILGARVGHRVSMSVGCATAALGLALIALRHDSAVELAVYSTLMYAGLALCFAAMPNLMVDAAPPDQTGEATGFNALVRTGGSSLGAQVCAAVLAGGVVAGGGVAESSYRTAFLLSAGGALVAAVLALCIPRRTDGEHTHVSALVEIGAGSILGEPPYAGER